MITLWRRLGPIDFLPEAALSQANCRFLQIKDYCLNHWFFTWLWQCTNIYLPIYICIGITNIIFYIFVFYFSSINDIRWFPDISEETIKKFSFQSFLTFSFLFIIIFFLSGNIPLPTPTLTVIFAFVLRLNIFSVFFQLSCHVFTSLSLISQSLPLAVFLKMSFGSKISCFLHV